jgi:murein L,D-transpeptidase YcbB/YkuD
MWNTDGWIRRRLAPGLRGAIVLTTVAALGPTIGQRADRVAPELRAAGRAAAPVDSADIASALAAAVAGARPPWLRKDQWAIVARLYRPKGTPSAVTPLWLEAERPAPRAGELAAEIAAVDSLGLHPKDYGLGPLREALRAATPTPPARAGAAALARADLLLTASFVALVDDLLTGRLDPRQVEPSWHIAPRAFDVGGRIVSALESVRAGERIGGVLAGLRPDYGSYGALLQALGQYRALERGGGWPQLPKGQTLRLGDAGAGVPALRRRLAAEGYTSAPAVGDTLDATLAGAVAQFQRRHGLSADSAVGPRTRAALDIPAATRVRQIEANLERLRWLPVDPGERFVVVNVPAFVLYAFQGTARVLTMPVVVGDELTSRRTPIFADTMEFIQFGPYWNVPRSIAVNEILPKARSDRGYLARNNYQILRGWGDDAPVVNPRTLSDAALFSARYRVRQEPGPDNALGRVKFMFPNDYAVYLHDTPSKARFEQADRAVSHGCVRVADPEALAAFVLQDRSDWPRDSVARALATGRRVRVNLKRRGPPVYLIYLTAFGRDGQVFFRDDVYDRDDRLLRALAAGRSHSAPHRALTAAIRSAAATG